MTDLAFPLVVIGLILLARFAFLRELEYPLYNDAAVHYQIIENLQDSSHSHQAVNKGKALNFGRYYHLGFHSMVAVLDAQWGASNQLARWILACGHVFLAFLILNMGILSSRIFNIGYAGIVTTLLVGLGWTMPAFAVNWGKYPAIASLAVLPLAMYWMIDVFYPSGNSKRFSYLLFGASALCAVLLHSRSFVLLACGAATLLTLRVIENRLLRNQMLVFCWVEIGLFLLIAHFHPNLGEGFSPYIQGIDLVITLSAVVFLFFVVRQNTRVAIGLLTFMLYLSVESILPIPDVLASRTGAYLLDRPFLQIFLFAPLSLFAGGGFSYLMAKWFSRSFWLVLRSQVIKGGIILSTVLAILLRPVSDFKPNPCCVYMTIDDIFLIGWMKDNLPTGNRILVSTDSDINTRFVQVATDAGAWIHPLTELETIKYDYRTDFSDAVLHRMLCKEEIQYIYVSAVNTGFSVNQIENFKHYYSPMIVLPDARLYSVNC